MRAGYGRITAVIVFVTICVEILFVSSPRFNSDAFYYLTVARNVSESGRFTYDGIQSTSGFHWLWLIFQIALSEACSVVGLGGAYLPTVILICCSAFYAAGSAVLSSLIAIIKPNNVIWTYSAISLVVALDPYLINSSVNGLETSFFLLVLLGLTSSLARGKGRFAGVLFQLLIFTRIEALALSPFLAFRSLRSFKGGERRWLAALSFPWAALLVLALNFAVDGRFASSSSLAKKFWAHLAYSNFFQPLPLVAKVQIIGRELCYLPSSLFSLANYSVRGLSGYTAIFLLLVLLAIVGWRRIGSRGAEYLKVLGPVVWFSALSFAAYKFLYFTPRSQDFSRNFAVFDYQSAWYFVPHSLIMLLSLHLGIWGLYRPIFSVLLSTLYLMCSWSLYLANLTPRESQKVSDLSCVVPENAILVAQNDDGFAYQYRQQIVLLDGLVSGHNFQNHESYLEVLSDRRMDRFIRELSPRYIRVGTTLLLRNVGASKSLIDDIEASRKQTLCGMGLWFDTEFLARGSSSSPVR